MISIHMITYIHTTTNNRGICTDVVDKQSLMHAEKVLETQCVYSVVGDRRDFSIKRGNLTLSDGSGFL